MLRGFDTDVRDVLGRDAPVEEVDDLEFRRRLARGDFAFHWRAHGLSYGVPAEIDDVLGAGRDVIFNGSREALPAIMERYPDLRVVLVTAPNAVLAERLSRAQFETPEGAVVVVNDGSREVGIARFLNAIGPEKDRAFSRGQVV